MSSEGLFHIKLISMRFVLNFIQSSGRNDVVESHVVLVSKNTNIATRDFFFEMLPKQVTTQGQIVIQLVLKHIYFCCFVNERNKFKKIYSAGLTRNNRHLVVSTVTRLLYVFHNCFFFWDNSADIYFDIIIQWIAIKGLIQFHRDI